MCPVPQFLVTSAVKSILLAPPAGNTQSTMEAGPCTVPLKLQCQLNSGPSAQLPAMPRPCPPGAAKSSSLACSQPTAVPGNACTGTSVHEKFHRWQHYKPLACRHLSQSPNAEALSCLM